MEALYILVATAVILFFMVFLDVAVIPRPPLKPLRSISSIEYRKLNPLLASDLTREIYGPEWNPQTLDEFLDFWMTLNDEEKYYIQATNWSLAA